MVFQFVGIDMRFPKAWTKVPIPDGSSSSQFVFKILFGGT